jgi:hypothetical protein
MNHRFVIIAVMAVLLMTGCKPNNHIMSESSDHAGERNVEDLEVDPEVTHPLFLKWRTPRFGTANPERMNNPVWEWLVKSKVNAYIASQRLGGPSAMDAGPGWCFDRFGQSLTSLPDGRTVLVGGEHEDYYDPDFYVYNDVVVLNEDGRMDIFGYPKAVFPPTDFHSATLVSNQIVLIGCLGYPEGRRPSSTPVFILDLITFAVRPVKASGTPPGWIHGHKATLAANGLSILVERGKLDRGGADKSLVENIDDWRLHFEGWRWERLTERKWPRWEVRRKDGEMNHLFDYRQAVWAKEIPGLEAANSNSAQLKQQFEIPSLEEELGHPPDLDLFAKLYRPPVKHEVLPPAEDVYGIYRIKVDGVIVRYVEDLSSIQITIEGDLPENTAKALTSDLLEKQSRLENAACELIRL